MKFKKYTHHGKEVWVRKDLQGKHREYCLCFKCKKFKIDNLVLSCYTANLLFKICCDHNIVAAVWECPKFVPV